ncbi:MAG TPA: mechanosensitive ion channel [Chloroflexi bacterium]|nr:mechanosensitive ion channel [Chloroflexota bacterium]
MNSAPTVFQIVTDFWLSLLKLLGRPAVQMQLLAAGAAVLAAWLLARVIVRALHSAQTQRRERIRRQIIAAEEARQRAAGDDENQSVGSVLLFDEAALDEAVARRLGATHHLLSMLIQIVYPALATLFLYGAYVYFVVQGWYSGLLGGLVTLFAAYLVFRLLMGLAYAVGNPARVQYYHQRFFGPLFGVFVVLLVVNTITDITTIADATVLHLEEGWLSLGALFAATVGFYFWIMAISLIKDLIKSYYGWRTGANTGSLNAALTLVQYGLIGLGLFAIFNILQFNPTTVAAITGGLSIGIGFALQDVLKNFLGGIIVLFEGSVRPGDWVEVAGAEGEVDKLSIRSTVVRTFDNVEYIVPNQDWLSSTVTTYTRNSRRVRTRVPVGVSYNADPHAVQKLLIETALAHPDVVKEPPPAAPLVDFGASSVDFVVLAWVDDAKIKGKVAAELRMRIWDALKAAGVEIPFPQQDVHIRSGLPHLGNQAVPAADATKG